MLSRVRFELDPFTGELDTQVLCSYGKDIRRYDCYVWTSDLRYFAKTSTLRPLVLPIRQVK